MSNPRLSSESLALLETAIAEHGLESVAADIVAHAMESVTLEVTEPEDYARTSSSRYGGVPDLPPEIAWPRTEDGLFLNFLMQVNLGEMPPVADNPLPEGGMLYFFLESDDPATNIACRVLYYGGDFSALTRAGQPDEDKLANENYLDMVAHRIIGVRSISLPGDGFAFCEAIRDQFSTAAEEPYRDLRDAVKPPCNSRAGRLLGYTNLTIGDPRQNAFLVRSGQEDKIYDYTYHNEHKDEIASGVEEWRLLWRLDSNRKADILIWDAGFIQVLIHKDDLAKGDFSRVYAEVYSS